MLKQKTNGRHSPGVKEEKDKYIYSHLLVMMTPILIQSYNWLLSIQGTTVIIKAHKLLTPL